MQSLSESDLRKMTEAEQSTYEEALRLYERMKTPLSYMQTVTPTAKTFKFLEILESHVLALIEHRLYPDGIGPQAIRVESDVWVHPETGQQTVQFLAITCPPRHGKSFYVSDHLPAWYLTRFPDNEMILTAYESRFAQDWSEKARTHIIEHPEFGVEINPRINSKEHWAIKGRRGAFRAAGAGGPINGKGADLIIGDDLISNAQEAYSKVMRENLWNWYLSVFKLRRHPDGVGIMMFTRWHEDDLIGRCTTKERGQWYLLNLPAIAFDEVDTEGYSIDPDTKLRDHLNRKPGEALCPERYPKRTLERIRSGEDVVDEDTEGGEAVFSAMFQGKPSIEGKGIIPTPKARYELRIANGEDFGTYELYCIDGTIKYINEKDCFRFSTTDWAVTKSTQSDYCVITTFDASKTGELMVRNVVRTKLEQPEHIQWLKDHTLPRTRFCGVEDKSGGQTLIQNLRQEPGTVTIFVQKADTDKISRALPFGREVMNGRVFFPKKADWLADAEYEMTKFPNAAHDDIVDTMGYSLEIWRLAPKHKEHKFEDTTTQGRVNKRIADMKKKKKPNFRHGTLGRWN